MGTKKDIRNKSLEKRSALSRDEWNAKCINVLGKLMHHPLYESAKTIYCYVSYNNEVDTWPFIAFSLSIGKRVAVPKVTGNEMEFFYIESLEELEAGYKGIFEPVTNVLADDDEALMVMPVVAFDRELNRIGYGGGYYDRYLTKHGRHTKLGVAFDFQETAHIPAEETDIRLDVIVTDKKEV